MQAIVLASLRASAGRSGSSVSFNRLLWLQQRCWGQHHTSEPASQIVEDQSKLKMHRISQHQLAKGLQQSYVLPHTCCPAPGNSQGHMRRMMPQDTCPAQPHQQADQLVSGTPGLAHHIRRWEQPPPAPPGRSPRRTCPAQSSQEACQQQLAPPVRSQPAPVQHGHVSRPGQGQPATLHTRLQLPISVAPGLRTTAHDRRQG